MLYQLGPIPNHQDAHDPHNPAEPRRYTIYLTDPKHNTFYFSKEETEKNTIQIYRVRALHLIITMYGMEQ